MGRTPNSAKNGGLRKGPWTTEEDQKLIDYIRKNGYGNWRTLPKNAGLQRCGKSCRLRWTNYLRPDIKRGKFSFEEEQTIIQLHGVLGNKWSTIASSLPGRTDNEIKNYWNTHIRKQLIQMGIDPVTHQPRLDLSSILSLFEIQPVIDLEPLRLAALFLATQGNQNLEFSYPSVHQNNLENTLQFQENNQVQDQIPIQKMVPNFSPSSSLSCGVPFSSETSSKLMEPIIDKNVSDLEPNTCPTRDTLACINPINHVTFLDECYHMDPQSNFSNKVSLSSFMPPSTCTPPSSRTPVNSSSNSGNVGERTIVEDIEQSYCSNVYEFQKLLNASVFM